MLPGLINDHLPVPSSLPPSPQIPMPVQVGSNARTGCGQISLWDICHCQGDGPIAKVVSGQGK